MTAEDISPWTLVIGVWIVVGVIVIAALVKAWPAIRRAVQTIEALSHLPEWMSSTDDRFDTLTGTVKQIHHEVFPNNGGSMRDELDRQSKKLDAALTWQEKHETKSDATVARVDKLEKEKNQ